MPQLLHELIDEAAARTPEAVALVVRRVDTTYAELAAMQDAFAAGVASLPPGARVAIWLPKSVRMVAAAYGAAKAGCAFVPVNPLLKPAQVDHILNDCGVALLVTSADRLALLGDVAARCPTLERIVVIDDVALAGATPWNGFVAAPGDRPRLTAEDVAAIFYTSGSTGRPKGVVVPHRSMVTGAIAVADYLEQRADDRLLGVMPLSFDAGFSQTTTAFLTGATCVLMDYALPGEVVRAMARERITGVTGVPAFWSQLAALDWPAEAVAPLRYWATTGGRMPQAVLDRLRMLAPDAKPYLMYGLTEAFRSTWLPPEDIDRKLGSIGRAIPGQRVDVRRTDGTLCDPDEPGELVHRGSTVTFGYWNDAEATAARFGTLPHPSGGVVLAERAVFSGDRARMDAEGYLYFVGRDDEMIKSSGYRISPVEVEEAAYVTGFVAEAVAYGIDDAALGQRVALVALARDGTACDADTLRVALKVALPGYMVPSEIAMSTAPLPRNPNGKIDRRAVIAGTA